MQPTDKDFALAQVFLNHSLAVKPKEKVLIMASELPSLPLAKAVYIEALKLGAFPMVDLGVNWAYHFYTLANEWQLKYVPRKVIESKIEWADTYVRLVADENTRELAQLDAQKLLDRTKLVRPLMDKMVDSDRWVLTFVPTTSMAQEAGVSYDWLQTFYYDASLVDYQKMRGELTALEKIMDEGKRVHVLGKETDLRFSIESRSACACYGTRNIPDGEVFLAPVHDTLEGRVYFDLPTMAFSQEVKGIYLEFKGGRIVKAKAEINDDALQKILETDEGARYIGEFAIGANYNITVPMKNTLFDEKIGGTIHMALGRAYKEKRGGGTNESAIHWDIVKDMRMPEHRVTIDDRVVLDGGELLI